MHAFWRALPLALSSAAMLVSLRAQPAERPPIFVPLPVPALTPTLLPDPAPLPSTRMRALVTQRALAAAADLPADAARVPSDPVSALPGLDGAVQMQRFIVRSVPPPASVVEPPPVPFHFELADRSDRRAKGYTANLLRWMGGARSLDLSVLKGAGNGVDHGHDFTRVELSFSLRW
jgi:hypothetical protein